MLGPLAVLRHQNKLAMFTVQHYTRGDKMGPFCSARRSWKLLLLHAAPHLGLGLLAGEAAAFPT